MPLSLRKELTTSSTEFCGRCGPHVLRGPRHTGCRGRLRGSRPAGIVFRCRAGQSVQPLTYVLQLFDDGPILNRSAGIWFSRFLLAVRRSLYLLGLAGGERSGEDTDVGKVLHRAAARNVVDGLA